MSNANGGFVSVLLTHLLFLASAEIRYIQEVDFFRFEVNRIHTNLFLGVLQQRPYFLGHPERP